MSFFEGTRFCLALKEKRSLKPERRATHLAAPSTRLFTVVGVCFVCACFVCSVLKDHILLMFCFYYYQYYYYCYLFSLYVFFSRWLQTATCFVAIRILGETLHSCGSLYFSRASQT